LSVDNLKLCNGIFHDYMLERFDFDTTKNAANVKKKIYEFMLDVANTTKDIPNITIKDMNNFVLNHTRDYYKSMHKLTKKDPTPNVLLAQRGMTTQAPSNKQTLGIAFTKMETDRNYNQPKLVPKIEDISKPVKETAFDLEEFTNKMNALKSNRDMELPDAMTSKGEERRNQDTDMMQNIEDIEPKEMFTNPPIPMHHTIQNDTPRSAVLRQDFIIPQVEKTYNVEKYLIVNGFDRNWVENKHRFKISTDANSYSQSDLQNSFRNIRSISIKRAIIPQEIVDQTPMGAAQRTTYNFPFNFSFPYVMITIDEISNVFDGTNDAVRRGFCQMIVDKHYRAQNGRGFLVLQAMQDEKKVFYPSPLSSLPRLSISVNKPNGELFNQSQDNYSVYKIDYEPFNPQYLKITLDRYFDKNEFYKGDTIKLDQYIMPDRNLCDYINQKPGHDIVEMGQPNQSGYFRSFYIRAFGVFDSATGSFVLDQSMILSLNAFNASLTFTDPKYKNGEIINMTLQCVFSFKIDEILIDPGATNNTAQLPMLNPLAIPM
jgi:hypothetical protein